MNAFYNGLLIIGALIGCTGYGSAEKGTAASANATTATAAQTSHATSLSTKTSGEKRADQRAAFVVWIGKNVPEKRMSSWSISIEAYKKYLMQSIVEEQIYQKNIQEGPLFFRNPEFEAAELKKKLLQKDYLKVRPQDPKWADFFIVLWDLAQQTGGSAESIMESAVSLLETSQALYGTTTSN